MTRVNRFAPLLACLLFGSLTPAARAAEDKVFADFEGPDFGEWKVEGKAFGGAPTLGKYPTQWVVEGFQGRGLANSFNGGDPSTGKLISPTFTIAQKYISFLIGGGGWDGKTCVNLMVGGKVVRTATGPNTEPGGSEKLEASGWDVGDLVGQRAGIEIVDSATGGWGHINVDQIVFTEAKPALAATLMANVTRPILAGHTWLNFPVKNGAKKRTVFLSTVGDGKIERRFDVELADGEPDWWGALDISAWRGKTLTLTVDQLRGDSHGLEQVRTSEAPLESGNIYHEALRPQFHFSAQRGWLNDPNGLVFYRGEYHMFFQHCPFSWSHAPNFWGHAVSKDLVHWQELGEALAPDEYGGIWSGSAVVDWKNTSGFGPDGQPPLVLVYTAGGETQRLAYSTDGRSFTKFAGTAPVKTVTSGNRDPKVLWHEPTQRWVMALYVEKDHRHTTHFFTSPNLRDWTLASVMPGGAEGDNFLFECPDIFSLPLDGDATNPKWVLMAANTEYVVGSFDGQTFTAETSKLAGQRGGKVGGRGWMDWGFYAPQTFSDEPKGRRIQLGWFQTATAGMPFNQSMSIPLELRLISTPEGPRLSWTPIRELEALRRKSNALGPFTLEANAPNPLAALAGELWELRAEFETSATTDVSFTIRGVTVTFDAAKQELTVNGRHAPAPVRKGHQNLAIFVDRTGLEVFASAGTTFVPMPVNLDPKERSLAISSRGGSVNFNTLEVHELRSIWADVP